MIGAGPAAEEDEAGGAVSGADGVCRGLCAEGVFGDAAVGASELRSIIWGFRCGGGWTLRHGEH